MDDFIQQLASGPQPIIVGGPSPSAQELGNRLIKLGYLFIKFTKTKGETDLVLLVDQAVSRLDKADFATGIGQVHIEGTLTLNFTPVRCVVEFNVASLSGLAYVDKTSVVKENIRTTHSQNRYPKPAFSWGIDRIGQRSLPLDCIYHELEQGGTGVNVYLVDTGIDYGHHDLACRAHYGYDTFGGNGADELGNGTFIAGVIAAIAPKAALYSVKVLNGQSRAQLRGF